MLSGTTSPSLSAGKTVNPLYVLCIAPVRFVTVTSNVSEDKLFGTAICDISGATIVVVNRFAVAMICIPSTPFAIYVSHSTQAFLVNLDLSIQR